MAGRPEIDRAAVELGLVTEEAAIDARRVQLKARLFSRIDVGFCDALALQGIALSRTDRERLARAAGPDGIADDTERRFGALAVERGLATQAEVDACLAVQRLEDAAGAPHRLIGEILVDRGYLPRAAVHEVVADLFAPAAAEPEPEAPTVPAPRPWLDLTALPSLQIVGARRKSAARASGPVTI